MRLRPAVFLDRDGTIIEDTGFVREPDGVRLVEGAAEAIARLNTAGVPVVVVTNQSGIARGLLTEADYTRVAARAAELLAERGARVDATYFCPHHPDVTGPCDCRKPGLALFQRAADDLGLDLAHSWWIGDRLRDLLPARAFGGEGVLIRTLAAVAQEQEARAAGFGVADSLAAALATMRFP